MQWKSVSVLVPYACVLSVASYIASSYKFRFYQNLDEFSLSLELGDRNQSETMLFKPARPYKYIDLN